MPEDGFSTRLSGRREPIISSAHRRFASLAAAALFAGWILSPAAQAKDDPSGLWLTNGGGSVIKIGPCGKNLCGVLVWLKEPADTAGKPKIDRLNEDPSKRSRPMIGISILLDLEPQSDHWQGKAYNPKDGKTYDITFRTAGDKAEVEGCVMRILCATDTFVRTQSIPKPLTATP